MTSKTGYRIGSKTYNPDTSILVCETPQGKLFKKKGSSFGFFLYNPDGETSAKKIMPLTWADANNLTKTYAPREVHLQYFSTYGKETDAHKGGNSVVRLDEYHRIKAHRNAEAHHMRMTEYIKYLIDRDDKNNNYCK